MELYFVPMIAVLLFLFYFISSDDWNITNGITLVLFISAFLPLVNIAALFMCVSIWTFESKWFNTPLRKKK